ncbi:MAG: hypothetical protein AAF713_01850, partial [Pseudomonadota bacterium]
LIPLGGHALRQMQAAHQQGDVVEVSASKPRSRSTHNWYFAMIQNAWQNLPEWLQHEDWAKSAEHLRAYALIATGQCTTHTLLMEDNRQAAACALLLRAKAPMAVTVAEGNVVVHHEPISQSERSMSGIEFKLSAEKVIGWICAEVLDCEPAQLMEASA